MDLNDKSITALNGSFSIVYGIGGVNGSTYEGPVNLNGASVRMSFGVANSTQSLNSLGSDGTLGLAFPAMNEIKVNLCHNLHLFRVC